MARQRRAGGGVDQLPSGQYRVRVVTPEGKRVSLGTFPTKRAAESAYARSLIDQLDGKRIAPTNVGVTLADFALNWTTTRLTNKGQPLRPRTKELYENELELHILPVFGELTLGKITTARVRSWTSTMRGPDGPGASTAAKCYRLLRAILGTAVEDGLIAANPCTIKGAGKEPESKRPVIPVAQAFELADLIGPHFRAIVLLAAFVGLRKGEMLGLRRRDLDLDAALVDIGQQRQLSRNGSQLVGPPKTDAGVRVVAIPEGLLEELRHHVQEYAQPGDDGYIFTGVKGGPLSPGVLQAVWSKARHEIGRDEVHLHDLRHLAGTLAASTGAGTKELMYRFGHASPQAALRYQHATRERDGAIAAALDELIRPADR